MRSELHPALRIALAIAVLLLCRTVLRQTPPSSGTAQVVMQSRTTTTVQQSESARAGLRFAPPGAPADPVEVVWQDLMRTYGQRLQQSTVNGRSADYWVVWAEIGSYLRMRNVSTPAFQTWMSQRGWSADEQDRILDASGYRWPPLAGLGE